MTYTELLDHLYKIDRKGNAKYDLSKMQHLSALLSRPETHFSSVHIAGSNGKGSVSTKIAKALEFSGLKVGLYTSPHIATYRERIRINRSMISEEEAAKHLQKIFDLLQREDIEASFFEITTLAAFCYFAEQKVDYAVIEAGIGGRLDATNIILPKVCAITSISLEHTAILGNTLEEITREKAGIVKLRVPVVIGPSVPIESVASVAEINDASCIPVKGNFVTFDEENGAVAAECLKVLRISEDAISQGCALRPACRLEKITPIGSSGEQPEAIILDVAHNPDGFYRLFRALRFEYPTASFRILYGLSENKDLSASVGVLKTFATDFHLVAARSHRSIPVEKLYEELIEQGVCPNRLYLAATIEENLEEALRQAARNREVLVVCGSFFIMAPVRAYLGLNDPCDPVT